ncbi:hypothetical protein OG601_38930 [Streptomyces sp. NBC_01239]|uniref:hypothetical protein n=1 Tax=Streptomyces sp. NBC_01239 TaxID=2903792 RepID=UPI00224DD6EA|nr:hypothetical protein [Streptomyces sp. NBC_01239]MCX4816582.1 hypothetical protein [Streptomyces sp. NBC_01239]
MESPTTGVPKRHGEIVPCTTPTERLPATLAIALARSERIAEYNQLIETAKAHPELPFGLTRAPNRGPKDLLAGHQPSGQPPHRGRHRRQGMPADHRPKSRPAMISRRPTTPTGAQARRLHRRR